MFAFSECAKVSTLAVNGESCLHEVITLVASNSREMIAPLGECEVIGSRVVSDIVK